MFLKLVLQKLRFVLLLRYAPDMEKEIMSEVSPDDFEFLKKIAVSKSGGADAISPELLSELLTAYDAVGRAYIPALPIEIALVKLFAVK